MNFKKTQVKEIHILLLISVIFVVLLLAVVYFTNKNSGEGLKKSVQSVLQAKYNNTYTVGKPLVLKSGFVLSAACFELQEKNETYTHAIIIRITGMSGPICAVYTYSQKAPPEFAGIAGIANPLANPLQYGITLSIIDFWAKRIPEIGKEVYLD